MRTGTGWPVVLATSSKGSLIKVIDLFTIVRAESHMNSRFVRSALRHPEIRLGRHAVSQRDHAARKLFRNLHQHLVTKRCQGTVVEAATPNWIADFQTCMIDHCVLLSRST